MKKCRVNIVRILGFASLAASLLMLYLFVCHKKVTSIDYPIATDEV